jgi:hypothetical protein
MRVVPRVQPVPFAGAGFLFPVFRSGSTDPGGYEGESIGHVHVNAAQVGARLAVPYLAPTPGPTEDDSACDD